MVFNYMKKEGAFLIFTIFLAVFVFQFSVVFGEQNDTMILAADILPYVTNVTTVSIEVPDYVFFGNLTKGGFSEEIKVTVNNTGTVNVIVTPELTNSSEKIFNNTYFRTRKTSGGIAVPFTKLGDFNFRINKSDSEYFYISLDLTNYTEDIPVALPNHQAELTFFALPA